MTASIFPMNSWFGISYIIDDNSIQIIKIFYAQYLSVNQHFHEIYARWLNLVNTLIN